MSELTTGQLVGLVVGVVLAFLFLLFLFLRWYTWRRANRIDPRMPRVPIDMEEYAGQWYEIASNPSWFENGCSQSTAYYQPEGDHLKVINRCVRNGRWDESVGRAYPTDYDGVLGVSFFPGIYGNYTLTYRDANTAIVTDTDRKYLWILSRKPQISGQKKTKLLRWLAKHDFDTSRLSFQGPNA